MIIALLAAGVLMAAAEPAAAPTPAPAVTATTPTPAATPASAPVVETPKKSAMVCRNEPSLGSRMPTRRCRTPEQIAAQKLQDQTDLDHLQRSRNPGE